VFSSLINEGKQSLMELSSIDRFIHIFWLIGPFILLIERSPADIWMSTLGLAFLFKVIKKHDYKWIRNFWVGASFAFWLVCLTSALFSSEPAYAFGEAFVWIRFPLFAMATVFWLGRDERLLYLMLLSTAIGFLLMCCILTGEIIYNREIWAPGQRLSWPYGDFVPGNYLTKGGLPVIVIASAIAVRRGGQNVLLASLFMFIGILFVTLTGERINTLILVSAVVLAGAIWRPSWQSYAALLTVTFLFVVSLFYFYPELSSRFITQAIILIPTGEHSAYYRAMMPGFLAFEQSPIFGIGTGNFRNLCQDVIQVYNAIDHGPSMVFHDVKKTHLDCHPHPHNYYIQLLAETGIIGFLTGVIFMWSIVWTCFRNGLGARDNVYTATAWVVPFALFWPTASTADFFGQWNNIFLWSSVSLALASTNLSKS